MTPLAKKELAKLVFFALLALNTLMTVLHTFLAQVTEVQVLRHLVAVGVLVALGFWFILARRLKRTTPSQVDKTAG